MFRRFLILILLLPVLITCGHDEILAPSDEPVPGPVTPPDVNDEGDGDDADDVNWAEAVSHVFNHDDVAEIHIRLSRQEWDRLIGYYDKDKNTQEYVVCRVEFSGRNGASAIDSAGLRLKGNTSRRRPQEGNHYRHVHFGVNLHKFVQDASHTIHGVRKFDLKWFKDDPSYTREIYCYDLFRRQGVWTAIHSVYARLWIQVGDTERYYGVYELMEHIDKNYLRTRVNEFGSRSGNLWKCHWGANLSDDNAWMLADNDKDSPTYELKTNKTNGFDAAKKQLKDFIRNVRDLSGAQFDSWISTHMDVPLLLKTYAVNVAVGMWDDYWNNSNNYYLYFNSVDEHNYKVWFIPYDYDNTLGTSSNCGVQNDSGRQNPLHWGMDNCPLISKILQNSEWKALYIKYLKDLCAPGGDFYHSQSEARIVGWQNIIRGFVNNDTGEDCEINDWPAGWGNHPEYRLLESGSNNFFEVKESVINAL